MSSLIISSFRRLFHGFEFYIGIAATLLVALLDGILVRNGTLEQLVFIGQIVICAFTLSMMIVNDDKRGIFRNRLICGEGKGRIFAAELITGIFASTILFIIHFVILACFGWYFFSLAGLGTSLRLIMIAYVVMLDFVMLTVSVSCLFSRRTATLMITVLFVMATFISIPYIRNAIKSEEYIAVYDYVDSSFINKDGKEVPMKVPDFDTERLEANPEYVGKNVQKAAEVIYRLLPFGRTPDDFLRLESETERLHRYFFEGWEYDEYQLLALKESVNGIRPDLSLAFITQLLIMIASFFAFRKKNFE